MFFDLFLELARASPARERDGCDANGVLLERRLDIKLSCCCIGREAAWHGKAVADYERDMIGVAASATTLTISAFHET